MNTNYFNLESKAYISSVELVETSNGNIIEIIKRQQNNTILTSNPPQQSPDSVWKEVYGIVDGKIQLINTIQGRHTPSSTIHVSEKLTFEDGAK